MANEGDATSRDSEIPVREMRLLLSGMPSGVVICDPKGFSSGDRTVRETMLGLWEGDEYLGMACVYEDIIDLVGQENKD